MFTPKTFPLEHFAARFPERIKQLESLLNEKTIVYIDYGNVRGWSRRLGWMIDLAKLKDFLNSFGVRQVWFYFGTYTGDSKSEKFMSFVHSQGFKVRTKHVKIMSLSIDVSSISNRSPDILTNFIDPVLLKNLRIESIEYLNDQLRAMNKQGRTWLECSKCNFDVEIASDMRLHHYMDEAENFCLWSGDSDFEDPLKELLDAHRTVSVVGTARHIASEINALKSRGLKIFDLKTLREFLEKTS
ncbi:MAG TPA: NYN domain-containing protein [Acidobacteriaceae bacterium]|jgi:uncharacterized LabA/DUF88 family protein